jgi:maltooligosyltrehalose synthase
VTEARTRREALVAELLGELDSLLHRVERLTPDLDAARERLNDSSAQMTSGIETYRTTIAALTERAQTSSIEYIVRRTNETTERGLRDHTEAMKVAARGAFDSETAARLRQLTGTLERAIKQAESSRWHVWLTHSATALLSGAGAAALAIHLIGK